MGLISGEGAEKDLDEDAEEEEDVVVFGDRDDDDRRTVAAVAAAVGMAVVDVDNNDDDNAKIVAAAADAAVAAILPGLCRAWTRARPALALLLTGLTIGLVALALLPMMGLVAPALLPLRAVSKGEVGSTKPRAKSRQTCEHTTSAFPASSMQWDNSARQGPLMIYVHSSMYPPNTANVSIPVGERKIGEGKVERER